VSQFMAPGLAEILGLLPPRLACWARARVRGNPAWRLRIATTKVSGFAVLRALAALRSWRPYTLRFKEENAWVERWLDLIDRTLQVSPAAAREVVASAALVRGYAETYDRAQCLAALMEEVVEPMLAGRLPQAHFAEAVLQARVAASKDPEGAALAQTLAAIGRLTLPQREGPATAAT